MAGGGSTTIYTGSPTGNPHAVVVITGIGVLEAQSNDFRHGVGALRMGIRKGNIGYAAIPEDVELVLTDGTKIRGKVMDGATVNPKTGDTRLIVTQWDSNVCFWTIVNVYGERVRVVVHRNPPDPTVHDRPPNAVVIPPTTKPSA